MFTRQWDLSPGTQYLLSSTLPLQPPLQPPRPPRSESKWLRRHNFRISKFVELLKFNFFFFASFFFFWSEIFFWKSVNNNLKSKSKSWAGGRELKKMTNAEKKLFSKRVETFLSRDKLFLLELERTERRGAKKLVELERAPIFQASSLLELKLLGALKLLFWA